MLAQEDRTQSVAATARGRSVLSAAMGLRCDSATWTGEEGEGGADVFDGAGVTTSPNILLITIDTLRRDHLGCYGYSRPTSPTIDSLARAGVIFDQAVTPSPKTTPALTSVLTGLYPKTHRILTLGIPVSPSVPFISQELRARGYATAGICGQHNCHRVYGFDRGFDYFDDEFVEQYSLGKNLDRDGGGFHPDSEKRAEQVIDSALRWLERRDQTKPFFLWLHLMDPHAGYAPPDPYLSRFSGHPPSAGDSFTGPRVPLKLIHRQARVDDIDSYAYYLNQYDAELRYLDDQLGRLLVYLHQRELFDASLILLAADHGEYMGESNADDRFFSHGDTLYESEITVPLIAKLPGRAWAGSRSGHLVSLVDVAPTVLSLAAPGATFASDGVSLLRSTPRAGVGRSRQFVQMPRASAIVAVRDARYKVVIRTLSTTTALVAGLDSGAEIGFDAEVYDLLEDPLERKDIALRRGDLVSAAASCLSRWLGESPARVVPDSTSAEPSGEMLERLRSLGYVQ
jgi:arylsulfatase A-like enzyme